MSKLSSTQSRYQVAIGRLDKDFNRIARASIENKNPDASVIDEQLGHRAESSAKLGKIVVRNMGTGYNIINTAIARFKEVRSQLESIKQNVTTLNPASAADLVIAQDDYQNNVFQIIKSLSNLSFFGKKLADGSLAAASPADSGIPANNAPYQVQSQADGLGYIGISIPRLIAGAATAAGGVDPAVVAGAFQPVFGLSAGNAAAAANAIVAAGGANGSPANGVAVTAPNTPEGAIIGAYAQQVALDAVAAGVANTSPALKAIYSKAAIDKAATISAGDVTTPAGRMAIMQSTDQKIAIFDTLIAALTGKQNCLKSAESSMEAQIIEEDAAAHNYLDPNPRQLTAEATNILRTQRLMAMIQLLSERSKSDEYNEIRTVVESA